MRSSRVLKLSSLKDRRRLPLIRRFSSDAEYKAMLLSLPDYTSAMRHVDKHEYSQALPLLYRVNDVIRNAMSENSSLYLQTNLLLAQSLISIGKYQPAKEILLKNVQLCSNNHRGRVISLQHLSKLHLVAGNIVDGLKTVEESIEILETTNHADADVDLFHASYSYAGKFCMPSLVFALISCP
jgi:tetratricopeptide (TPR) repeat protein